MTRFWHKTESNMLLRAAIAFVFFVLASLQPALYTTAAAGAFPVVQVVVSTSFDDGHHTTVEAAYADHQTSANDEAPAHHHGAKDGDKRCEAHCAPASALPVNCPALAPPGLCRHQPHEIVAHYDGFTAEFVKPPRI